MRLSAKIALPMLLVVVVLGGVLVGLLAMIRSQQASIALARTSLATTSQLTQRLGELQDSVRADLLSYYFDSRRSRLDRVEASEREIRRLLASDPHIAKDPPSALSIEQFEEHERKASRARADFVRATDARDAEGVRIAFEKLMIYGNRTEARLHDVAAGSIQRLDRVLADTLEGQLAMLRAGVGAGFLALLLVAASALYLRRNVGARLDRLASDVERIDPAIETRIDPGMLRSHDEIGELARAFEAMAGRLRIAHAELTTALATHRRTEERLAGVIDSAMDGIIAIDPNRRIVLVNPAAERVFGYSATELIGEPLDLLVPERFHAAHAGHIDGFGRAGVTSRAMGRLGRVVGRRSDGSEFPVEASISRAGAGDDRIYTVILRDISLRVAAEQSTRDLTAQLRLRLEERDHAIRELEAFCYSVSHDLRAPLRAIDGLSRIALEDYGGRVAPGVRSCLEKCSENATHMGRLIDELLALSRVGRHQIAVQVVDPAEQVRECLASLEAERRGRRIEVDVGPLEPYEADRGLMRQVWLNLLANAVKYTGRTAAARIDVGSFRDASGACVYFVRDNGAGFDMRFAAKLFQPFQRLHTAAEFPGTGVGLAIVQRVVQRHGGRVWAEGKPGAGATFYFTLATGASDERIQAH